MKLWLEREDASFWYKVSCLPGRTRAKLKCFFGKHDTSSYDKVYTSINGENVEIGRCYHCQTFYINRSDLHISGHYLRDCTQKINLEEMFSKDEQVQIAAMALLENAAQNEYYKKEYPEVEWKSVYDHLADKYGEK